MPKDNEVRVSVNNSNATSTPDGATTVSLTQKKKHEPIHNGTALLEELKNTTHFFRTTCTNYNGEIKTAYAFFDLSLDWFGKDEVVRNSKTLVANGGALGKIEEINANIRQLYLNDKDIKEFQTAVFGIEPFRKCIEFCKEIKE